MVNCPLVNREIDIGECVVTVDACDGAVDERILSKRILEKDNWKDICRKCKHHDN